MTKKNWIILVVSVLIVVLGVVPGITYLVRHGHLSNVTLSTEDDEKRPEVEQTPEPSVSVSPTPSPTPSRGELNPEDRKKMSVLNEIFESKNDNDPRMDTELVRLSPELKAEMARKYQALSPESRNERGTIVFLIGREVKSLEDVNFLTSVLMEKPCLSLSDCSKPATASSAEDVHLDGMNETTANYPQLMAVRQLIASYRRLADQDPSGPLTVSILQSFRESLHSPNPRVADEARRALQILGKSD